MSGSPFFLCLFEGIGVIRCLSSYYSDYLFLSVGILPFNRVGGCRFLVNEPVGLDRSECVNHNVGDGFGFPAEGEHEDFD